MIAVLPLLLMLGIVELIVRATILMVGMIFSLFVGLFMLEDNQPGTVKAFMTPVCFTLAERLANRE